MPKEDDRKYFEILEIDSDASSEEIEKAYLHLKRLYSSDSVITLPIADEFPDEEKQQILSQVEEAYRKLSKLEAAGDREQQMLISEADTLPEILVETAAEVDSKELVKMEEMAELPDLLEDSELEQKARQPGPVTLAGGPGQSLREVRESQGKSLAEIARQVEISSQILEDIELEKYEALPEAGHLRWCIMTYARHLCLDARQTADEYMKTYRQWKKTQG